MYLLKPIAGGRLRSVFTQIRIQGNQAPLATGQAHSFSKITPNARLHIAMLVALAAASLILLAVPIARTSASGRESARAPVSAAGDGFVSALRGQAEMVTAMMAPPTSAPGPAAARTDYVSRLQSVPGGRVIPATLLAAAGQLAAGAAFTSPETQASMIVQRQGAVSFTLHEEGMTVRETSSQLTVGQALAGLGMKVGPRDIVRPSADSRLTPGLPARRGPGHGGAKYPLTLECAQGCTLERWEELRCPIAARYPRHRWRRSSGAPPAAGRASRSSC